MFFVRYILETATHNAELVLWSFPVVNEHKRILGKIPYGYTLRGIV